MALSTAQLERALTSRQLQLILLPTEQCNFRCTYCYEDFAIGRMREPVRRGVKSLITSRAAELHTLSTQWFGGEPLAAKDVVIDISRHIQKVCTDHPQLRYHGAMTTNAYLLDPQTLHELVGLGIRRYQISLDGWGAAHDETRRRADGKGTFERVWANLRAAKQLSEDFSILIRVHLQPRSIGSVERLLAEISEHFADDPRFDVFFMAISNWGGPNSQGIQAFSAKEGEQLMQSYQARWRPSKRCGEERSAPAQSGSRPCGSPQIARAP